MELSRHRPMTQPAPSISTSSEPMRRRRRESLTATQTCEFCPIVARCDLASCLCVCMLTAIHVSACRFSLPEQKIGALFNEKFKKTSHTVENTHAHNLRIEIAAKLVEKFGSVERAFEHYTEGDARLGERAMLCLCICSCAHALQSVGPQPPDTRVHVPRCAPCPSIHF